MTNKAYRLFKLLRTARLGTVRTGCKMPKTVIDKDLAVGSESFERIDGVSGLGAPAIDRR